MIPARPGYVAVFGRTDPESSKFALHLQLEVHAWDDDGCPMVIPEEERGKRRHRRLVRADALNDYDGIERDRFPEIVALIPSNGWRVRWHDDTTWSEPLVGWGVTTAGSVVPLASDDAGDVGPIDRRGYRVYHRDSDRHGESQ